MTNPNNSARTPGAAEPRPVAAPTLAETSEANAARRRNGLLRFMERHELTPTELARIIDLPSPNAIYNFVAGRSTSLNTETMERILASFPDETFDALIGRSVKSAKPVEPSGNTIPLSFEACAGLWTKRPELHAMQRVAVPIPEGLPHPGVSGFAARVGFQGAERLYRAGSLLICGPLPADQRAVPIGAKVIVRRESNRDHKVEITVREVVIDGAHAWLWPRSTHPEHQTPIRTSWPAYGTFRADGRTTATILGYVLASWQPEIAATTT